MIDWECCICGKEAFYNVFGKKYCQEHMDYDGVKEPFVCPMTGIRTDMKWELKKTSA